MRSKFCRNSRRISDASRHSAGCLAAAWPRGSQKSRGAVSSVATVKAACILRASIAAFLFIHRRVTFQAAFCFVCVYIMNWGCELASAQARFQLAAVTLVRASVAQNCLQVSASVQSFCCFLERVLVSVPVSQRRTRVVKQKNVRVCIQTCYYRFTYS